MTSSSQVHKLTLASKVTILRILGVPVFVLLMVYYTLSLGRGEAKEYQRVAALAVFLVVALTDALDGYLARSRNEITRFGRIIDPLADKALLVSGLILLTRPSLAALQPQFPIAFTLLVISRDVVLVSGAVIVHHLSGHVDIRPRWTGKVATFLLMLAVTWALVQGPPEPFRVLVWACAVFITASWAQYLFDGVRQIEHEVHHPPHRT
jgi:CDP-diacylglycerol--glycerol-3-phosphate 3-phosphatidyltransferase